MSGKRLDPGLEPAQGNGHYPVPGELWQWEVALDNLPAGNKILAAKRVVAREVGQLGRTDRYARLKQLVQRDVALLFRSAGVVPLERADFGWCWWTSFVRVDPDNLVIVRKFILDALVEAGILADDGWSDVLTEHSPGRFGWLWESFHLDSLSAGGPPGQVGHGAVVTIQGRIAGALEVRRRQEQWSHHKQRQAARQFRAPSVPAGRTKR